METFSKNGINRIKEELIQIALSGVFPRKLYSCWGWLVIEFSPVWVNFRRPRPGTLGVQY